MNEHQTSSTSPFDLGPSLGHSPTGYPPPIPGPVQDGPGTGTGRAGATSTSGSSLDKGFDTLRRSPLRRDSSKAVLGGVCAGIARSTGLSVVAVRTIAVVAALFFGTGVGAYLLAWALLPDEHGSTHAEQAMRGGRPRSMVVLGLGTIALIGVLSWVFDSWPLLILAAVVAFVVAKKQGHFSADNHTHG